MEKLYINPDRPDYGSSFMLLVLKNDGLLIGDEYVICDWFSKSFITKAILVGKKRISLGDMSDSDSYMLKDCDCEMLSIILRNQYQKKAVEDGELKTFIHKKTIFDILYFTKKSNVKKMMEFEINQKLPEYFDVKKSLTSKKSVLPKSYKHKPTTDEKISY